MICRMNKQQRHALSQLIHATVYQILTDGEPFHLRSLTPAQAQLKARELKLQAWKEFERLFANECESEDNHAQQP